MHNFFSAETQWLFDDVLLLPQDGAATGPTGRPPNSYAVLLGGRSVLFDAVYSWALPGIRQLADDGHPPEALVVSHHHVAAQGDAFEALQDEFDLPILLHPDDAQHRSAQQTDVSFENPTSSDVLAEARLDVIHVPAHTEGSVMLYAEKHGGFVLAGDSAVGPGPRQGLQPPRLERPPTISETADQHLRDLWRSFGRPLRTILPLHGATYVDRDDLAEIMQPLIEGAAMTND